MQAVVAAQLPRLHALCREFGVRRLALFGSARRADFDAARSDLDFLVEFSPLGAAEHRRAYFGLHAALEELFARPVDLVEWATIRNPYLRSGIEQSQEMLYVAA
jgi:predicted nucleotidyltransferase